MVLLLGEEAAQPAADGADGAVGPLDVELLRVRHERLAPGPQLLGIACVPEVEEAERADVGRVGVVEQSSYLVGMKTIRILVTNGFAGP